MQQKHSVLIQVELALQLHEHAVRLAPLLLAVKETADSESEKSKTHTEYSSNKKAATTIG